MKKKLKLNITTRRGKELEPKISMLEKLRINREKIEKGNLIEEEVLNLKRLNLLEVQSKFYEVMEKHPHVFKISLLSYNRKKLVKERQLAKESDTKMIDDVKQMQFVKKYSKEFLLERTQQVSLSYRLMLSFLETFQFFSVFSF